MIADVLTSIKAYLYDRTSSPLLGAFATSLALWNFKILMLFFSKTPYAVKVWEIDFFYSQPFFSSIDSLSWLTNYWMCLYLMPAVTSLFYIYVFPWFSHRVFEFSYNKQIALNNKKKEMQGSELISAEEKEELLSKIEKLNVENRANVLKLREEITQLESQRDSVIKEREDVKSQNDELRVENDELKHRHDILSAELEDIKRSKKRGSPVYSSNTTIPADELNMMLSGLSAKDKKQQDAARRQIAEQASTYSDSTINEYFKKRGIGDSKIKGDAKPSYIRFFQSLSPEKQEVTWQILESNLGKELSLDELSYNVDYEQVLGKEKVDLKKHLNEMKFNKLIDLNDYSEGPVYSVTPDGQKLYHYILEGRAFFGQKTS
ncbi:hypothetical protein [Vibrio jasicida]|uniref:hypothetical protein n=1 Tax=Vibrio jasicida TaxID=766224 RepID=UPI0040686E9E